MTSIIIITLCVIAYAIKGGWHGKLRNKITNPIIHRLLDGKILSTIIFTIAVAIATTPLTVSTLILAPIGWLLCVAPKIGRPIGDVGGIKGNWDKDENAYPKEQRNTHLIDGLKAGAIRHIYGFACLSICLGPDIWILAGAAVPLLYFIGVSIEQLRTKQIVASWHLAEPIVGLWIGYILALTTTLGS